MRYASYPCLLFAAAASLLALAGCQAEPAAVAQSSPRGIKPLQPAYESPVTIHFVRDALGVADKQPIPIGSGNHNGADLVLNGVYKKMDADWVVISERGRDEETWVARKNILYMKVGTP